MGFRPLCASTTSPALPASPSARCVIITASGGPFRTWSRDQIEKATPEQALRESLSAAMNTNAPGTVSTVIAPPVEAGGQGKGAVALMQKGKSLAELHQQASGTSSSQQSSKPKTQRELVREELERRLMTTVPVSDNDVLALMQRRIESVQRFLVDSGGVSAERLFPVAPKAKDTAKGQARVLFTLN